VVVTEEEVGLVVVEGWSSRKEHGPRRIGVCEERVLALYTGKQRPKRRGKKNRGKEQGGVGVGGWKSGACGAQMRGSGVKAQTPRRSSQRWRESTGACAEEQRGEGRKDDDGQYYEGRCEPGGGEGRTVLARMKRQDYLWIRKTSGEG
jgi:hypothetical protein